MTAVLPVVLTELAGMTGDAVRTEIASLVGAAGRGLGLATGAPAVFDGDALKSLAADPEAYLRAHLGDLLTEVGRRPRPVPAAPPRPRAGEPRGRRCPAPAS